MSDISPTPDTETLQAPGVGELALAPPVPVEAPDPAQVAAISRMKVRAWSTFTFAICASILLLGLYLKPDPRGLETHRQLGLLPCGFFIVTGMPCPTCGCTTAVSQFAHGNLAMSFFTQPFGFAVALVAALLIPPTTVGIVTGRWLGPSSFWLSWHWRLWVYGGLLLLLSSWLYKIWLVKVGLSG